MRRLLSRTWILFGLAVATASGAAAQSASIGISVGNGPATPRVQAGFFYDELSPYGSWTLTASYGWAWRPERPAAGWRPYLYGRWVPSDHGWLWVSDEPFGWATYHYGRWAWDPRLGWIWVPGTTWGPAWVSWQTGGGYYGWAPLPPEVGFDLRVGLQLGGVRLSAVLRPDAYVFVPERSFLQVRAYRYAVPAGRNVTILRQTKNVTHYRVQNRKVINRGPAFDRVARATGQKVRPFRVETGRSRDARVSGSRVELYRPSKKQLADVRPRASSPRHDGRGRPSASRRSAAPDRRSSPKASARGSQHRDGHDARGEPRSHRKDKKRGGKRRPPV